VVAPAELPLPAPRFGFAIDEGIFCCNWGHWGAGALGAPYWGPINQGSIASQNKVPLTAASSCAALTSSLLGNPTRSASPRRLAAIHRPPSARLLSFPLRSPTDRPNLDAILHTSPAGYPTALPALLAQHPDRAAVALALNQAPAAPSSQP
jgi:hypothetical protein